MYSVILTIKLRLQIKVNYEINRICFKKVGENCSCSLYSISRIGWGVPGPMGVLFYIGERKKLAFLHTRNLSKTFKQAMKNLQYLNILLECLRFFEKPSRFYRDFR